MRLILHIAAYWLMLTVKDAIAKTDALAKAEFTTLRLALIKIGARIIETASRVRIAFSAACPNAALFRDVAARIASGAVSDRATCPPNPNPSSNAFPQSCSPGEEKGAKAMHTTLQAATHNALK
jgi:hypothetical protein